MRKGIPGWEPKSQVATSQLSVEEVRSGSNSLAFPRVFNLFVTQNAFNLTEFPTAGSNLGAVGISAPGSCILFDASGSQYQTLLEVALDERQAVGNDGNGNAIVTNYFPLYPGASMDFRPGKFGKLFLRATGIFAIGTTARNFIGRIIISSSLITMQPGVNAWSPMYTRPTPAAQVPGSSIQGITPGNPTDWAANGTGRFTFKMTLPTTTVSQGAANVTPAGIPLGIGTAFSRVEYVVKNRGPGSVYISGNPGIVAETASNNAQTYELEAGEKERFILGNMPNSSFSPSQSNFTGLIIYTDSPGANIQFHSEFYL